MKSPWPPRLVLGAIPPGEAYCSVGDPPYWMACMTRAEDASGEPHLYFITSAASPRLLCFACKPESRVQTPAERVSGPISPIEPVPPHPPAILDITKEPPWGYGVPIWKKDGAPLWLEEEWNERAAIMEHDGGLSRAQAEHAAYRLVLAMA